MAAERPAAIERDTLYALDEAIVMFPRERAATRSKAKYLGWQELTDVGMGDDRG